MTAPATAAPAAAPGNRLTGTMTLLRFMLRRDRIRLPAWVLGSALAMVYFTTALQSVLDEDGLAAMASLSSNPIMALVSGPAFGFEEGVTLPRVLVGEYGLYLMLAAAIMSILTVFRHTRAEEQAGRTELVRAGVAGRDAQLTAALLLTALMNVLVAVCTGLVVVASGIDPAPGVNGSFLFGFGFAAAGLVFAGVAAITAQLSAFSRVGSAIAGALLGAAFVVRGLGDMSAVAGGSLSWLSWLSPLGWSQQTAPFTYDRWWPLAISSAAAAATCATGYALAAHRDLGAGMISDRPGPPRAPGWLTGPTGLAFRLQRGGLVGWSIAMLVAGLVFGAFTAPIADSADVMPDEILAVMGGADGLIKGYLGFMGLFFAILISVFAVLSVQSLRAEEQAGRTEAILATAVGRGGWLFAWLGVVALGSLWLLLLAGLGMGLGSGHPELVGSVLLGYLVQTAPVWLLLGLAVALFGWFPRLVAVTWVAVVGGAFVNLFGQLLQIDQLWLDLSPFGHVGEHPSGPISWVAVGLLTAIGVVLAAVGVVGFGHRDLSTA